MEKAKLASTKLSIRREETLTITNSITFTIGQAHLEEQRKRMELCRNTFRSNCIGTALYISGEKDHDEFLDPRDVHDEYLKRFMKLESGLIGCLVVWQDPVWQDPWCVVRKSGRC